MVSLSDSFFGVHSNSARNIHRQSVAAVLMFLLTVSPCATLFATQALDAVPSKTTGTFWVQLLVHGKGDDFLFVLEHPARVPKPRRFRCRTSLPTFVEKIAEATDTTNGMLIAKVSGTIYSDSREESIDDLEVLFLCVLEREAVSEFIKTQKDVNQKQANQPRIIEKGAKAPPTPNRSPAPKRPPGPIGSIQGGRPLPSLVDRTNPELLRPVMQDYLNTGEFRARNEFAFRFSNRLQSADWWIRLASNASNPKLSEEEKHCVFHLASAIYTKNAGTENMKYLLNLHDDVLTTGVLNILLESRELSPDGADHAWPHSGPMGNSCIRAELVKLLAIPKFSKKASEVLGCYGEKGIDAIHKLVPVLLLDDASSQLAAASAILAIDPNGVAKTLGLTAVEPISSSQKKKISDWIRSQSLKPQPPFEQVLHYVQETSAMDFEEQRAAAKRLKRNEYDSEWWAQLALVADVNPSPYLHNLQVLSSELYSMPNSKKEIIRVLQGKDRSAIRGMLFLLEGFYHFEPGRVPELGVYDGDIEFWPSYVAAVLDKFPDLVVEVARALAMYPGVESKKEARRLIPFMLTNDPNQTIRLRRFFTDIDKETATMLGIAISSDEELIAQLSDQARVLTPEQRTKVESFFRQQGLHGRR